MTVLGRDFSVPFDIPDGLQLGCDEGHWHLFDKNGRRFFPGEDEIQARLSALTGEVYFDVQYVGQAFGKDGSRNALDRLRKHDTLQKISIKGIPEDHNLQLLLLKIRQGNSVVTTMNPFAEDKSQSKARIKAGVNKLFTPNEAERTTLYEASLIRYFEPPFNKEFKNSFPSTKLKSLGDCYEKDFAGLVAEINFDHLPFVFRSPRTGSLPTVMAMFNLHDSDDRDFFFSRNYNNP